MKRSGVETTEFPLPLDLPPMEARLVDELPEEPGWQFEPKWDGFRCLSFRAGEQIELRAKSRKPLGRYFTEMTAVLRRLEPSCFVLDGELAIPVGETFSFEALQMRLHPAENRIKKARGRDIGRSVSVRSARDARRRYSIANAAGAAPCSSRRLFSIDLDHLGFTATLHNLDRNTLTQQLEGLVMPPGFTGNAPGGPSRWSTERSAEWQPMRPEWVVEVSSNHVSGGRFRHGARLLRWRPDKAPRQCTFEQI